MSPTFYTKETLASILIAGGIMAHAATPITTVPWNGHIGAVSFTFDDGMQNQIDNLKPILDTMPDVKVTFFIPGFSPVLQSNPKALAALAEAGHEIGAHSYSHATLTGISTDSMKVDITGFTETLEETIFNGSSANGANPEPKITAFATPYCASNDDVIAEIKKHHFISRDCGDWGYRNAWDKAPNWYKFPALTWLRSSKKVSDITVALDTCIGNADFSGLPSWETPPGPEGQWMVVLNHGVAVDNDDYAIDPEDIRTILQHARDNKMWVASFSTIAAYQMAHFTLDSAEAVTDNGGILLTWELPSENMPGSIPLKVKLNSNLQGYRNCIESECPPMVMEQNGKTILPDSDSVYTIEFTELQLKIRDATAEEITSINSQGTSSNADGTSSSSTIPESSSDGKTGFGKSASPQATSTFNSNSVRYTVFDMNGNRITDTKSFCVPESLPKGIYIVRKTILGMNAEIYSETKKIRK